MSYPEAKAPLILRYHRLMDAFAKSDDERDFYLDRIEGFLLFADLDKDREELEALEQELEEHTKRYCLVPKMTFFEIKKFMEGFVQEKVYDIDTKEKLLNIISAKEARENFLEFIYDNLTELEKWQQYYQERSRVKIIEWLRSFQISFVFEEDLDVPKNLLEKVKRTLFEKKVPKDIAQTRETLQQKAKTYYSNEALNPRPKRGRPPKQAAKVAIEPQFTLDIYLLVPKPVRPFLYIPDITSATAVTFSAKFEAEKYLLSLRRGHAATGELEVLSKRLESLQNLTKRLGVEGYFKEKTKGVGISAPPKEGKKKFVASKEAESGKIGSAVGGVLPGRAGGEKSEMEPDQEGVYKARGRKSFSIKEVTPLSSKKKKGRKKE